MMDREAGFYTGRCLFAVIIMYQQLLPFTSTENFVVALYLHLYYYERSKFLIVDEGKIVRKKHAPSPYTVQLLANQILEDYSTYSPPFSLLKTRASNRCGER